MIDVNSIKSLDDVGAIGYWPNKAVRIVRRYMEDDPAHDEGHLVRVVKNCLAIMEREATVDQDVVLVAAILHDLVNVPKDRHDRNQASLYSADKAIAELRVGEESDQSGFFTLVHHAIRAHSYSANITPETLAAEIVRDADRLDSLGNVGLTRMWAVSGSMGRTLWHPTDPLAESRDLDEIKYGLDHFFVKLGKLHLTMLTKRGRHKAVYLTRFMAASLVDLLIEALDLPDTDLVCDDLYARICNKIQLPQ